MNDDDDRDDEGPESEGPRSVPLHPWLAAMWATGVLFTAAILMSLIQSARPDSRDPVVGHAAFAVALLLGTWAILRVHAPLRELPAALALRPSHAVAFVIAVATGVGLVAIDDWVFNLLAARFPLSDEEKQLFEHVPTFAGPVHQGVYVLFAAALSPAFEELFFRGALHTGIRRLGGVSTAVVACGLAFGLFHFFGGLRYVAVTVVAGVILGVLRELSGSSLVSLTAHVVANGLQVFLILAGYAQATVSHAVGAMAFAGVLLLLFLLHLLARRSTVIQRSRAEDFA